MPRSFVRMHSVAVAATTCTQQVVTSHPPVRQRQSDLDALPILPTTSSTMICVFFILCLESVASWQHGIDFTTSAGQSVPWAQPLPRGNLGVKGLFLSRKRHTPTTKKTLQRIGTCFSLLVSLRYLYMSSATSLSKLLQRILDGIKRQKCCNNGQQHDSNAKSKARYLTLPT